MPVSEIDLRCQISKVEEQKEKNLKVNKYQFKK